MKIYKYSFSDGESIDAKYSKFSLELPVGSRILKVAGLKTDNSSYIWALVDPEKEKEKVNFWALGTGQDVDPEIINNPNVKPIGTVIWDDKEFTLVWHFFYELTESMLKNE